MKEESQEFLFADTLNIYGKNILLLPEKSTPLQYSEIEKRSICLENILPNKKSLVFIDARNTVSFIIAYLACLRKRHAILLIDPDKQAFIDTLISKFEPDIHIRTKGLEPELRVISQESSTIHPDICLLLSTSGSTGSEKFVKLSYKNIQSNTKAIIEYLGITAKDRAITSLKPHYSYGLSIINTHIAVGASIALTELSINSPAFWDIFRAQEITSYSGVPHNFEMIDKLQVDFSRFDRLRTVTQAGGKLAPRLVRKFSNLGNSQGWDFIVMYGQTEAAPRISYLPADLAEDNAQSIGIPIPNGNLDIFDENGNIIHENMIEGELVYSGPNIMVGYASRRNDLASIGKIDKLFTGDLAVRQENGLYRITGRKSRFIKPFGIRLNLDDVESYLLQKNISCAVIGHHDKAIILVEDTKSKDSSKPAISTEELSDRYKIPKAVFDVKHIPNIIRTQDGKIRYAQLHNIYIEDKITDSNKSYMNLFIADFFDEIGEIIIGKSSFLSIDEIFGSFFSRKDMRPHDTFVSLGGDSLIHVEMTICIENLLGEAPEDWHLKTIGELRALEIGP